MKHLKGVLSTTHIDRHNERMSLEALKSSVEQINTQYIPVGVEHDPRFPPKGRIVSAELVEIDDGEFGVEGIIEMFEEGDELELEDNGREMPIRAITDNQIHTVFDRSYQKDEEQKLIEELREKVNGNVTEESKKSVEPISVLIIAVSAAAGSFLAGLIEKAGADTWDYFKQKIVELIRRRRKVKEDHILSFQFTIRETDRYQIIEVLLTNPTDEDIKKFFENGLQLTDQLVPQIINSDTPMRKITMEYNKGQLKVLFGVRKDAVPVSFSTE